MKVRNEDKRDKRKSHSKRRKRKKNKPFKSCNIPKNHCRIETPRNNHLENGKKGRKEGKEEGREEKKKGETSLWGAEARHFT